MGGVQQAGGETSEPIIVWTVGHSTRSLDAFLTVLTSHGIALLADVRRFPGSHRYPHFNAQPLATSLAAASMGYLALPELGGRRRPRPDSPHTAWRNQSFRGYADYMDTEPFRQGIDRLLEVVARQSTAIMCSEVLWWRCHRAMIGDYLKARGLSVIHIMDVDSTEVHPYTSVARIVDGRLTY